MIQHLGYALLGCDALVVLGCWLLVRGGRYPELDVRTWI